MPGLTNIGLSNKVLACLIGKGGHGRNARQESGGRKRSRDHRGSLLTGLLLLSHSASFLAQKYVSRNYTTHIGSSLLHCSLSNVLSPVDQSLQVPRTTSSHMTSTNWLMTRVLALVDMGRERYEDPE